MTHVSKSEEGWKPIAAKDLPPHKSGRKGLYEIPSPVAGEKYRRLNALKITIQDEELREQIMEFEMVNDLTEAHIARLLELALRAPRG